jgi:hypothetical protein
MLCAEFDLLLFLMCTEFYLLLCWVVQIFIYCCAECRHTECLGPLQTSFDHVNTKVFFNCSFNIFHLQSDLIFVV